MFERNGRLLYKRFAGYLVPTVLMTTALSMSVVADGIIVGNMLGADALAAVNLVLPLTLAFSFLYAVFGVGGSVLAAYRKGRRDQDGADRAFSAGMGALLLAALLMALLCTANAEALARLLAGKDPAMRELALSYLRPLAWGCPLLIVIPGFAYFLRTDGRPRLASAVLIVANIVNLCCNVLFIHLLEDVRGASLATLTGYASGGLLLLRYMRDKGRGLRFRFEARAFFREVPAVAGAGLSSGLSMGLQFVKFFCINCLVLSVAGASGMVAFSVCIACLSLASMFISGASQSMMPIVGVLFGEGDYRGIRFIFRRAFFFLMGCTLILVLLLEVYSIDLARLFGARDSAEIAHASMAVDFFAPSLLGTAFSFLMSAYAQTIRRPGMASAVTVAQGFAVVLPAAWLLSRSLGLLGIWLSFSVAEVLTLVLIFFLTRRLERRSEGRVRGLLMLPAAQKDAAALDVTIAADEEQAVELSEKVTAFCLEKGIGRATANRVGIAVEEMAVNTARHGGSSGKSCIDIAVAVSAEDIRISFRDDGVPFNPLEHGGGGEGGPVSGGIALVKALAQRVEYAYALGFNSTVIVIGRPGAGEEGTLSVDSGAVAG